MERITYIKPAYDKRSEDPKKNYGVGCARFIMLLKGAEGAITFEIPTGMYLPKTQEIDKEVVWGNSTIRFAYHWHTPLMPEYENNRDSCEFTDGTCYFDCDYSRGDTVRNILVSEGNDAVWEYMENYYKELLTIHNDNIKRDEKNANEIEPFVSEIYKRFTHDEILDLADIIKEIPEVLIKHLKKSIKGE